MRRAEAGTEESSPGPQARFWCVGIFAVCFWGRVPSACPLIPRSGAGTPEEAPAWPSVRMQSRDGRGRRKLLCSAEWTYLGGSMQAAESPNSEPDHRVHPICAHQLCDFWAKDLTPLCLISQLPHVVVMRFKEE